MPINWIKLYKDQVAISYQDLTPTKFSQFLNALKGLKSPLAKQFASENPAFRDFIVTIPKDVALYFFHHPEIRSHLPDAMKDMDYAEFLRQLVDLSKLETYLLPACPLLETQEAKLEKKSEKKEDRSLADPYSAFSKGSSQNNLPAILNSCLDFQQKSELVLSLEREKLKQHLWVIPFFKNNVDEFISAFEKTVRSDMRDKELIILWIARAGSMHAKDFFSYFLDTRGRLNDDEAWKAVEIIAGRGDIDLLGYIFKTRCTEKMVHKAFVSAARHGHLLVLQDLLSTQNILPWDLDSALSSAVSQGHEAVCLYLRSKGAAFLSINASLGSGKTETRSALLEAIRCQRIGLVEWIVRQTDIFDDQGPESALLAAAEQVGKKDDHPEDRFAIAVEIFNFLYSQAKNRHGELHKDYAEILAGCLERHHFDATTDKRSITYTHPEILRQLLLARASTREEMPAEVVKAICAADSSRKPIEASEWYSSSPMDALVKIPSWHMKSTNASSAGTSVINVFLTMTNTVQQAAPASTLQSSETSVIAGLASFNSSH